MSDNVSLGKYMHANPIGCEPHEVHAITARDGSSLGHAEWYSPWRCYVFSPEFGVVLSHDCCLEMSRFLESCNKATKIVKRERK